MSKKSAAWASGGDTAGSAGGDAGDSGDTPSSGSDTVDSWPALLGAIAAGVTDIALRCDISRIPDDSGDTGGSGDIEEPGAPDDTGGSGASTTPMTRARSPFLETTP